MRVRMRDEGDIARIQCIWAHVVDGGRPSQRCSKVLGNWYLSVRTCLMRPPVSFFTVKRSTKVYLVCSSAVDAPCLSAFHAIAAFCTFSAVDASS